MHLQHKIPWNELVECLRIDASEILLPIGECGKIHLIDKATKIKVSSRKFLTQEDICFSKDCKTASKLGRFSKNKLSLPILPVPGRGGGRRSLRLLTDKLKFINEKFWETVLEFVACEEAKFEVIQTFPKTTMLPQCLDMKCFECYQYPCRYACKRLIVFSLYSSYQIEKLLWFDSIGELSIVDALTQYYGGQAVGNGYSFLMFHLFQFYVVSNAIIACGYQSNENKWGQLAPNECLRRMIQHDCDFLTFIPTLRPYLHKDVFMKDMEKTMELLRIVFRHIYVYIYLRKRYTHYDEKQFRQDFNITNELYLTYWHENYA